MNIIMRTVFGSHLYGTDTSDSDRDFKGIFMPSMEQIMLNRVPKSIKHDTKLGDSKNTSDDIEEEFYSLHYFIELASKGETVALDMLHAPEHYLTHTSDTWRGIVSNRDKFYTKNLKALVGYARKQAAKYGIRGSRLHDTKRVMNYLKPFLLEEKRLSDVWFGLPKGEHIREISPSPQSNDLPMYEVCGRKVQSTAHVRYAYDMYEKFYNDYGDRARQAAENTGIDWKAVSHAIRAGYQIKEILTEGTITFPLKEKDFVLDVKLGKLDYTSIVAPELEGLIDECDGLAEKSSLPENVDKKFWDGFLFSEIVDYYKISEFTPLFIPYK